MESEPPACLHVTSETAKLILALKDGGALVARCASNPLSTQDDVAAAVVPDHEVPTCATKGEDNNSPYRHINAVLDSKPQITMDGRRRSGFVITFRAPESIGRDSGRTEETTTGVIRLPSMAQNGILRFP